MPLSLVHAGSSEVSTATSCNFASPTAARRARSTARLRAVVVSQAPARRLGGRAQALAAEKLRADVLHERLVLGVAGGRLIGRQRLVGDFVGADQHGVLHECLLVMGMLAPLRRTRTASIDT